MSEKYTDKKTISKNHAVQKHDNDNKKKDGAACKVAKKCGGCQYQGVSMKNSCRISKKQSAS